MPPVNNLSGNIGQNVQCSVSDCTRLQDAKGYCGAHYQRVYKYGDPRAHIPIAPSTKLNLLPEDKKTCIRCEVEQPLEEFTVDKGSPNGRRRHSVCRSCAKLSRRERAKALIDEVTTFKLAKGCTDCGYADHPMALHFDHRPGERKLFNVATGVWGYSPKKVWDEIAKCDVVCANCHAIRTGERMGFSYVDE